MRSYRIFTMPVILAIAFPLFITSCKKDVKSEPPASITEKSAHKTIVIRADENARVSYNTELNLGVKNGNTDWSSKPAQELDVLAWTFQDQPVILRPLMRFAQLPCCGSTTEPIQATLTLFSHPAPGNGDKVHANYGTNNGFYIRRVTSPWDWTTLTTTWFDQPPTTGIGKVYVPHTNEPYKDLVIDVTRIIKDIYKNGNYGIILQLQTESYYNSRIFCHSTYPDVSKRPYLTIEY